jgi:cytochrome P450
MGGPYDLQSAAYFADPYPAYEQMRRDDPAYLDPARGLTWLTRYEDVFALSRAPGVSVARVGQLVAGVSAELADQAAVVQRFLSDWLVFSDPPRHTILRKLQSRAFSARSIAAQEPGVAQVVADTLDPLRGAGEIDIIADVAAPVPAIAIARMLGVPDADIDSFRAWTAGVARALAWSGHPDEDIKAACEGVIGLEGYFRELIAARRRAPGDDLLSALVSAEQDGVFLNEQELVSSCALLLVAGHETTTNMIGNGVLALLRHPDQLRRLREQPGLIDSAVEEFQRYDSASGVIARVVLADTELAGQVFTPGQAVAGVPQSANRDPAVFADPDRFDIGRDDSRHLGFGQGPHLCLGAALARLETRIVVSALLDRFPRLDLLDEDLNWYPTIAIRGMAALPVAV